MTLLRCKMKVQSLEAAKNADGSVHDERIKLTAVLGPENEPWSKWTPAGVLDITVTNPDAFGRLRQDQEVYVDLVEE